MKIEKLTTDKMINYMSRPPIVIDSMAYVDRVIAFKRTKPKNPLQSMVVLKPKLTNVSMLKQIQIPTGVYNAKL